MQLRFKSLVFLIVFFCFNFAYANIAIRQNTDEVRKAVENFLHQNIQTNSDEEVQIRVGYIDHRLQLTACQTPLDIFLPDGITNEMNTVGVRCSQPKSWTLYIPVNVKIFSEVLVSTRHIAHGEIINESDIRLVKRDRQQLRYGYFKKPEEVIGQIASQNIASGTALTQRLIELPNLITKGQGVTISIRSKHIYVEARGIAQDNGSLNKMIPVMNTSSKKVIQARVVGAGQVEVN